MTDINRRHLGGILLAASAAGLAGCAKISSAASTAATGVEQVTATIATDAATLIKNYGIAKGIGEVAVAALSITNPPAAAIIQSGITLVDSLVSQGAAAVETNASQIVSTTNDIIGAAAPAIQVVQNAASQAAVAAQGAAG